MINDLYIFTSFIIESLVLFTVYEALIILRMYHISAASNFLVDSLFIIQHSHPYNNHTYAFNTLILVAFDMFLLAETGFIFLKCNFGHCYSVRVFT